MIWRLFFISIFLINYPRFATASDEKTCSPVDIRGKLGSARNQNGTGWCFGYTAADLITQFMKAPNSNARLKVSAVDLSMMYFKSEEKLVHLDKNQKRFRISPAARLTSYSKKSTDITGLRGGLIEHAIKLANEQGVCLEKDLHSGDVRLNDAIAIHQSLSSLRSQEPEKPDSTTCQMNYEVAQLVFPNLKKEDFFKIMQSSSGIEYAYKLRDAACKNRLKIPVDLEVTKDESKFSAQKRKLDEVLNAEIAVGMGISSKAFAPGATGGHAISIVGRRYNKKTKECEYLIRDSKGTDCTYQYEELTKNCEMGHVWMKPSYLEEHMDYLIYVKPKSNTTAYYAPF